MDVWTNGGRLLLHTATTVVSADPSANNTVGFCIDAGDLGGFLTRGTAATKRLLG
jgi:hypothetical protein